MTTSSNADTSGNTGGQSGLELNPFCSNNILLECPVCIEPLIPPIYQCFNGHSFCNSCEDQMTECPICRNQLPKEQKIRNLTLEQTILNSDFACRRRTDGCDAVLNVETVKDHYLDCDFSQLPYCFKLGIPCAQSFRKKDLVEHMVARHEIIGHSIPDDGEERWIEIRQECSKGQWNRMAWNPHYILFQGKLFFFETKYSTKNKTLNWMLSLGGSPSVASRFLAEMKLGSYEDTCLEQSWIGPVTSINAKVIVANSTFAVFTPTVRFFAENSSTDGRWWSINFRIRRKHAFRLDSEVPSITLTSVSRLRVPRSVRSRNHTTVVNIARASSLCFECSMLRQSLLAWTDSPHLREAFLWIIICWVVFAVIWFIASLVIP